MIIRLCEICKKEFSTYPSRPRVGWGRFCSRLCRYNSQKGKVAWNRGRPFSQETKEKMSRAKIGLLRGANNPNWKGGVSSLDYIERRRFQQTIQKRVFERDNYTCQLCGQEGGDLQVDHIQPWAKYIELRFSINNCRTLCTKCHYQITFGKPMPKKIKGWGHNFLEGGRFPSL